MLLQNTSGSNIRAELGRLLLGGMMILAGCDRSDEPEMVVYGPVPDEASEHFDAPVTHLRTSGTTPAQIPRHAAVARASTIVFQGAVTTKQKGLFLPEAFVVEISGQSQGSGNVICASGTAYGTLKNGSVTYQVSLKAPSDAGRYRVKIISPGKEPGVAISVAEGEIEIE